MNLDDIFYYDLFASRSIKLLREEKGLTQRQLAEKAGVSEISIRKYEKGERIPKFKTIVKLAHALDVPLSSVLGDENIENETKKIEINDKKQKDQNELLKEKDKLLLTYFHILNDTGKAKAIEQIELITKIPEYKNGPDQNQE